MTKKRVHWVPRSSGGLVNLGMDMSNDMVSGLSYNTYTVGDGSWSRQVKKPEAPATVLPWERYNAAWRTMIPFRPKPKFPAPQPMDDAGLFSYLTMSWLTPFMIQGVRRRLNENTIPQLSVHDASDKNAKRLGMSVHGCRSREQKGLELAAMRDLAAEDENQKLTEPFENMHKQSCSLALGTNNGPPYSCSIRSGSFRESWSPLV